MTLNIPKRLCLVDGELQMLDGTCAKDYLREFAKAHGISAATPISLMCRDALLSLFHEEIFARAA